MVDDGERVCTLLSHDCAQKMNLHVGPSETSSTLVCCLEE